MIINLDQSTKSTTEPSCDKAVNHLSIGRKLLTVKNEFLFENGAICAFPDPERRFYLYDNGGWTDFKMADESHIRPSILKATSKRCLRAYEFEKHATMNSLTVEATQNLARRETSLVLRSLIRCARSIRSGLMSAFSANGVVTNIGSLSPASLNIAFRFLQDIDLIPRKIVVNASEFAAIRLLEDFDQATVREILTSNLFGYLWTADVHVTQECPPGHILVVADDAGMWYNTKKPASSVDHIDEVELTISEELGLLVYNDRSVLIEIKAG